MMKRRLKIEVLLVTCFFIININPVLFSSQSQKYDFIQESLDEDAKKYFLYLRANVSHLFGDFQKAYSDFHKLISEDKSPYIYDGFIRFLFTINNFKKITDLYDTNVLKSFSDNREILNIVAQSFVNLNQSNKAEVILANLSEKFPQDSQAAYFRAINLIKSGNKVKAIEFINSCIQNENLRSKRFLFYFLGAKVFLQMGQHNKAIEYSEMSTKFNPNYSRSYLLKGLLCEQLGKIKQAIRGYKSFLETASHNESNSEIMNVEKMLIRLLKSEKRFGEVIDILKKLEIKTPTYEYDLAFALWQNKDYEKALESINKMLQKNPELQPAKLLKIELLISLRKKDEMLEFIKEWLQKDPNNLSVIKILFLTRKIGINISEITNILESSTTPTTKGENLLAALIDIHFEQKNYKKVIHYCKKLFDLTNNPELKSKILFQSAYIHFVSGNKEKVEKILKMSLSYKNVYPSSYNLLAYFYAKNDQHLDKALKYVNLALEKIPTCYYYLDTKGYVLFKMGKISEAIKFFSTALRINPNDLKVRKHLQIATSFGK